MKKRAMKKYIPKNTDYCGKCKNLIYSHLGSDFLHCPKELESTEYIDIPVTYKVYRCRYTEATTEHDGLLYDGCKTCWISQSVIQDYEY